MVRVGPSRIGQGEGLFARSAHAKSTLGVWMSFFFFEFLSGNSLIYDVLLYLCKCIAKRLIEEPINRNHRDHIEYQCNAIHLPAATEMGTAISTFHPPLFYLIKVALKQCSLQEHSLQIRRRGG
jgi:hypothetical protein